MNSQKISNGNTFWVKVENGKAVKIRLTEVDTPEVDWKGLTSEEPLGKEASDYVKKSLNRGIFSHEEVI